MRNRTTALVVLMVLSSLGLTAQTKADKDILQKLPQRHCYAWNSRNSHELAMMMADDVDFVTVATVYLHGRADYERFHARLLTGRFKESTFTPLNTTVRFLRPDMAVVHWSWKITGDKNFDGTPRQPRFGMMTMVAEKRAGAWQVVVAQNTNSLLGIPPELEGIKTPIPVPGPPAEP